MFRRMGQGIELIKQSARVLALDKELLLFPLLSGIACLLVVAVFAAPLWLTGALSGSSEGDGVGVLGYVLGFGYYVMTYFVITFFNAAIVECAIIRFRGGDPTVADGLRGAASRVPQIFSWALVAATVGMILRAIEERAGFVGRIVVGLMGLAWSAATFFIVPVLVMERLGPIDAVKRSTELVRETWAESLTAHTGIGIIAGLSYVLAVFIIIGGGAVTASVSTTLGVTIIGVGVLACILIALCASTVQAIVTGALYMYAGQGVVPDQFERDTLERVFTR